MISTNINLYFGEKIEPRIKPKSVNILRSVKHGGIKIIMVQTLRIKPKPVKTPSDVGEPREDKDNGHIPSAVTGCLQFGEDATLMTRRLGAEAPKKKLVYQKKKPKPVNIL
jgi:hypothetical protein